MIDVAVLRREDAGECANCGGEAVIEMQVGLGEQPSHLWGIHFCNLCAVIAGKELVKRGKGK
jgi:hypothetical protein